MTDSLIQYDADLDSRLVTMKLRNSSVSVGESTTSTPELREFEVIDSFNGEQLAFIRVEASKADSAWDEILIKAHHQLLELHRKAAEQAALDREWANLMGKVQDRASNIRHYLDAGLLDARSVSRNDINRLRDVFRFLEQADGELDLLCDPEIDE